MSDSLEPIQEDGIENLPEEIQEIINDPEIPDDKKEKFISAITVFKSFSGPLPSPEVLEGYNNVVRDGAERIVSMAEKQSNHRMQLEDYAIKKQLEQGKTGQNYGFILVLIALGISLLLGLKGHETVATVIASTTIVAITTAFVLGKREQHKKEDE